MFNLFKYSCGHCIRQGPVNQHHVSGRTQTREHKNYTVSYTTSTDTNISIKIVASTGFPELERANRGCIRSEPCPTRIACIACADRSTMSQTCVGKVRLRLSRQDTVRAAGSTVSQVGVSVSPSHPPTRHLDRHQFRPSSPFRAQPCGNPVLYRCGSGHIDRRA